MDTIPHSWPTPAPIKAAFFDIDGTLAHLGTLEFVPSAIRALEALRANGIKTFLASGRGHLDLAGLPAELFDGAVMFNGQRCTVGEKIVHELRFSQESLAALRVLAQTTERALTFQGPEDLFSVRRSEAFMRVYAAALDRFPLRGIDALDTAVIYQASSECLPGEEGALAAQLPGCEIARWNPSFVDIIPAGGGKGCGIRAVLAHLGLACDEAVAFGDSDNDLSMFTACGTCIAVGGATPEVKAAATYITDDIDSDGILNACVRLGLV